MAPKEKLRQEIRADLGRLHSLIIQYASGDCSAKRERDLLEEEIDIKMAQWRELPQAEV